MKERKFELWMGCFENGIALCNKAVMEHDDYKKIGNISPWGRLKLYVKEDYIPCAEMEKIKQVAEEQRTNFLKWWNDLPTFTRYEKLLDSLTISDFCNYLDRKHELRTIEEKVAYLEIYLKRRR